MNTVKARKVGNSTTVTVPKEMNVKIGTEFVVYKGIDGVIVLAPRIENPFTNLEPFQMEDEFEGMRLLDNEIDQ